MTLMFGILMGLTHSAGELALTDDSVSQSLSAPTLATAGIEWRSDGSYERQIGLGDAGHHPGEWWTEEPSPGTGNLYEVAFTTLVSGVGPEIEAASIGVFIAMTSARLWSHDVSSGVRTGVWRFRVRRIADTSDFVEMDLTCTVSSL